MHLLQHKLQVLHSSVHIRIRRQELDGCRRDFNRLFSCPRQHHLRLLDHTCEECLRLLRPLLKIPLFAREVLRTTKAFHTDETRSVFPNLSCREIVDRSHCVGESRFCSNLSSQREQLLLKLSDNLFPPPAFHRTQARQATTVQQTSRSTKTSPKLRSHGQLSTATQQESSNDHQNSAPTQKFHVHKLCATSTHVTPPITTLP